MIYKVVLFLFLEKIEWGLLCLYVNVKVGILE